MARVMFVVGSLLLACVVTPITQAQDSGDARLVNSSSTNAQAGRLEIFRNGAWGTVCSNGFGFNEASVVCRQLGTLDPLDVGSIDKLGFDDTLDSSSVIWLDEVSCVGTEDNLLSCDYTYNLFGGLRKCSNDAPVVAVECGIRSPSIIPGIVFGVVLGGGALLVMSVMLLLALFSWLRRRHRSRHERLVSTVNM